MEHGATRNFQAEKLIEEEEKRIQQERDDEELNNPMKVCGFCFLFHSIFLKFPRMLNVKKVSLIAWQVLENRTKDSKMEMEVMENLQELKDLNQRQAQVDFEGMIDKYREIEKREKERQKEEDERETKWAGPIEHGLLGVQVKRKNNKLSFYREMLERALVKRLRDSDSDSEKEEESRSRLKKSSSDKPTDILTSDKQPETEVCQII